MKQIITIGREFGAGGGELGRRLARELGIAYYDRDIILRTAKASAHLTPEQVRRWDERVPHEFGFTQSLFNFYERPLSEELWDAQVRAIREIADKESCVIVGRNADYILREFDHCLRVFVHADRNWRLLHMRKLLPDTPMGVSRLTGSWATRMISRTLSTGISRRSAISSALGSWPYSCSSWLETFLTLLMVSTICTGMRMVRAWSAMARVMA